MRWIIAFVVLASVAASDLPLLRYHGTSHREYGELHGRQFAKMVHDRLRGSDSLQNCLLPFVRNTTSGKALYKAFWDTHVREYPNYMDELRGIAAGSEMPVDEVFTSNLRQEISYFATSFCTARGHSYKPEDHCSDYIIHNAAGTVAYFGHNEDSGKVPDKDRTFFANVSGLGGPGAESSFAGLTYAGDLCTGGWGWNAQGVIMTLNKVSPAASEVVAGGLGRVFVARAALDAPSLDAAIAVAVRPGQAGGHNYQLAQRSRKDGKARIVNVEAASRGRHAVTEIGGRASAPSSLFHANSYLHLKIPQIVSNSTAHRLARAAALPIPTSPAQAEAVLGDQADAAYPVFHDAFSVKHGDVTGDWTLQSLGVDMVK